MQRRSFVSLLAGAAWTASAQESATRSRTPDVPFVPTPQPVVEAMLKLADVKSFPISTEISGALVKLVKGGGMRQLHW